MTKMRFVNAWRRPDPKVAADARKFWTASVRLEPDAREERLEQIVALAYIGGDVAGAATAATITVPELHGRFFLYRCAVAPQFRRHAVSYRLSGFARHVLEEWSEVNPDEHVLGLYAVIQAEQYREKQREPIWPEYGLDLNLVAYNPKGQQIRVAWFKHAKIEDWAA